MLTIDQLLQVLENKKYTIYTEPFKINIVFIRSNRVITNKFDDVIYWFWKDDKDIWNLKYAKCTTKPGITYAKNPTNNKGVGILKEGQYIESHAIGYHKGVYKALVQIKPLTLWRDNDKDDWIDYVLEDNGLFGINIHRANKDKESYLVNNWSAACQVFANPFSFASFIKQCEIHNTYNGNKFTITLLNK